MAGLVFVKTKDLTNIVKFYIDVIGCEKWVSQPDIEIIKSDNFLIGFHQAEDVDSSVLFTFFYESKEEVDTMYNRMKKLGLAKTEPSENAKYMIYNFFAQDIEGRKTEFQMFLHDLPPIMT